MQPLSDINGKPVYPHHIKLVGKNVVDLSVNDQIDINDIPYRIRHIEPSGHGWISIEVERVPDGQGGYLTVQSQ